MTTISRILQFVRKRTGATYSAEVVGIPKLAKDGKFLRLSYTNLPTREELIAYAVGRGMDDVEALARGLDIMSRSAASGGNDMQGTLVRRLMADNIHLDIVDPRLRARRLNGIARDISTTYRRKSRAKNPWSLDKAYDFIVDDLK